MADPNPLTPYQRTQNRIQRVALAIRVLTGSILALPDERRDLVMEVIIRGFKTKLARDQYEPQTDLSSEL